MKHNGKNQKPEQNNKVETRAAEVPKSGYNPRARSSLETLKRMEKVVDSLKDIYPSDESITYSLLEELDLLLFTLMDECTKVPEIIFDGCIAGKENEYART